MKSMKKSLIATLLLSLGITAHAESKQYQATLTNHIIIPARTFINMPSNAPNDMKVSGKFTTDTHIDKVGTLVAKSNDRPTDLKLPFNGQPIQGHSGIKVQKDGTLWLLTDNGLGAKKNSPDLALMLNHYQPDWKIGKLKRLQTVFLHDPDKKVPFRIINENSKERYLTGSDFDPESFQIIGDTLWIGEEFGPYLIEADLTGKVKAIYETQVDGKVVKSPDNPTLVSPPAPDKKMSFNIKRSKGFEGMAMSKDGTKLYPLLEGPVWNDQDNAYENIDGRQYLRILEFDVKQKKYTGRSWKYVLENNDNAIGDFNMIDGENGLIIERDNFEGTTAYPCKDSDNTHCFDKPAKFKRVYKVHFNDQNVGQAVEKVGYIDLMNIQDPKKVSRKPLVDGKFVFPFFTIEDVDVIDKNHIVVGNDNNLPYSSSREPNTVDDNELIMLDVGDFLTTK